MSNSDTKAGYGPRNLVGSLTSSESSRMLIEERRQHILGIVETNGRVRIRDLSRTLDVSRITVRKDLDHLQIKGLLQRTHGWALPVQSSAVFDRPLTTKEIRRAFEDTRIGDAATKLVSEGQCVLLDSSTTTGAVTQALKRFSRLTVITNSLNIAAVLSSTDFEVVLTGGVLQRSSFSLVGPMVEDVLADMHADIVFLGVDGFDMKIGLTSRSILESRVSRAMVKAANTVVVVCDSTKFNHRSLSFIGPPSSVHHVITDEGLSSSIRDALCNLNIEVTLV